MPWPSRGPITPCSTPPARILASARLSRSKHTGVHSAFGEHFVKTGLIEPEYARLLINAFDSRLDADYEADFTAQPETAVAILDDARKFVTRIEEYLQEVGSL